jgi:hypothetical protein
MYYEEKIINGKLWHRFDPKREWQENKGLHSEAVNALCGLTKPARLEVMAFFCRGCGTTELPCHCQNDE